MLDRIKELIEHQNDFGFETTLSTRSYVPLLKRAEKKGYTILLIYFWLESTDLAKSRVLDRVKKGGHNISPEVIERRYKRGLQNFFGLYKSVVHSWMFYDNSKEIPNPIATGNQTRETFIYNADIWKAIQTQK